METVKNPPTFVEFGVPKSLEWSWMVCGGHKSELGIVMSTWKFITELLQIVDGNPIKVRGVLLKKPFISFPGSKKGQTVEGLKWNVSRGPIPQNTWRTPLELIRKSLRS